MRALVLESLRTGTLASLLMMPPGFVFQAVGWRVGHYGPKFAALWADQPGPPLMFLQHLVIGWLSAVPLLLALRHRVLARRPLLVGFGYGLMYYLLINALALPLAFGDPLPWSLGWQTVVPSLVVHAVFGLVLGWGARRFGWLDPHQRHSQA